jgi:iron(III) transport system permease protein
MSRLLELLAGTLALTAAVTVTALALGLATAWLTTRTDIPLRRFWQVTAVLPLVVPSYVAALVIIGAAGRGGLLSSWLGFVVPTPYGFWGAWIALSLFLAPMAHLISVPALRAIDPATEEAARGLGAGSGRVFFTITLPLLRPAMVSAGLLIGLYTVSDFGAVSLLRFDTFTRAIYTLYAGQIDRRPAAALSLGLMALALLILFVERRTRSRTDYFRAHPARPRHPVHLSGRAKSAGIALLAGNALVSLALPVAVLVFWFWRGVAAGQAPPVLWDEALRSMGVAGLAAILGAATALPVAMVTTWRRARMSPAVENAVWSVYSLPHVTVGVAVVIFALGFARPLYQTVPLLVITYVAIFLAQPMSAVQDSLQRASPVLEDASRSLGQGPLRTLTRVIVPLASPGLIAGATLVFLSVMKELPATLLIRPNEFETLAVRIWSATGEGFLTTASLASLALLVVSVVPLLALTYRDLSD